MEILQEKQQTWLNVSRRHLGEVTSGSLSATGKEQIAKNSKDEASQDPRSDSGHRLSSFDLEVEHAGTAPSIITTEVLVLTANAKRLNRTTHRSGQHPRALAHHRPGLPGLAGLANFEASAFRAFTLE